MQRIVVYLGNFGPETAETLLAKEFDGPVMFAAAAEETQDKLTDDRGVLTVVCSMPAII